MNKNSYAARCKQHPCLKYAGTFLLYLDWFMKGRNIRANPCYEPGVKYSEKFQWWWRDLEHEARYLEVAGKPYPYPCISFGPCDGKRGLWLLGRMIKHGLIVPGKTEGYEVTDHGRAIHKDYVEYLIEIRARNNCREKIAEKKLL